MQSVPRSTVVVFSLVTCVGCAAPSSQYAEPQSYAASCDGEAPLDRPLKLANYNIKSGMWTTFEEVAAVLQDIDADVIALEEVDNQLPRSGGVDQSKDLADRLGAERMFAGAWEKEGGSYGIALLSRLPILQSERFDLPMANGAEPRVGIDAIVCAGNKPMNVVASHADFLPWSAAAHGEALGEHIADRSDVVLMGDLNIPPEHSSILGIISTGVNDVLSQFTDQPTFADTRIDYLFTDREVLDARVIETEASDHKPVWTTMQLND